MKSNYIIGLLILFPFLIYAQNYPRNYFIPPLDTPLIITGTFGEIRNNHLHAGIDLSTRGNEGVPVTAAADGYISRIKIASDGYGKALYITHPNGFVTVYGHLEKFTGALNALVRKLQYERQQFELDINPAKDEFQVKQREVIAYSGNTGGSTEPHLHFEIRDERTEEPINPFLFGLQYNDTVAPIIKNVRLYPTRENGIVNHTDTAETYEVRKENGIYVLNTNEYPLVYGKISFGISVVDYQYQLIDKHAYEPDSLDDEPVIINDTSEEDDEDDISSPSPLGIYSAELFVDDNPAYTWRHDRLNFDLMKDVNAHIDYQIKMRSDENIERLHKLPGNRLNIYGDASLTGYLNFTDDATHNIKIVLRDFKGNTTQIEFQVVSYSSLGQKQYLLRSQNTIRIGVDKGLAIQRSKYDIIIPEGSFYDDVYFEVSENESSEYASNIFTIGDQQQALKGSFVLSIKPTKTVADTLKTKAVMLRIGEGYLRKAYAGQWNEKNFTAKCSSFGEYAIAIDTVPPTVEKYYVPADLNTMWGGIVQYKIKDALSGISRFSGKINGKWYLFEYDKKNDMITAIVDPIMDNKEHQVEITVTDGCGNTTVWNSSFYF